MYITHIYTQIYVERLYIKYKSYRNVKFIHSTNIFKVKFSRTQTP